MITHKAIVFETPQDVRVREDEPLTEERARIADGTAGAERRVFAALVDMNAESLTPAEMALDGFRSVSGEEDEVREFLRGEGVDDELEKRTSANLDHRFGKLARQLAETRSQTPGEYDDLHFRFFTLRAFHSRLNVHSVLVQRCSVDAPIRSRYSMPISRTS
jgi:hypothetical protein